MAKIPLLSTRPILFWRCFMKHTTPFFYSSFVSTASNCSDSCCIGWEIDIDQKTASYYHTLSQKEDFPFGKRLKEEISYEDIPHFILTPNERCPFLNHQNLCDIYIHLGEDHLCEICTQHPRFHEWFGDYKESGLGLCCEEAARLLLSSPEPLTFRTAVIEEEEDKTPFDKVLLDQLLCLRKEMFALLQDRTKTFSSRVSSLLFLAEQAQQQLDNGDLPFSFSQTSSFSSFDTNIVENLDLLLCFLQTLEPIDLGWPDRLSCIQKELPVLLSNREQFLSALHERMYEYEHLCVYFLYRYLLKATWDEDILSRVKFAVFSVSIIFLLGLCDFSQNGQYSLLDQIQNTKAYSKEIEYCDENLESVLEQSWNLPAFSTAALMDLISALF